MEIQSSLNYLLPLNKHEKVAVPFYKIALASMFSPMAAAVITNPFDVANCRYCKGECTDDNYANENRNGNDARAFIRATAAFAPSDIYIKIISVLADLTKRSCGSFSA